MWPNGAGSSGPWLIARTFAGWPSSARSSERRLCVQSVLAVHRHLERRADPLLFPALKRSRRSVRTATDTLSIESRLTQERRGTGSSVGANRTSLESPRIVLVHGATKVRRRRGIAASRDRITTGRRPIASSSHHQISPRAGSGLTTPRLPHETTRGHPIHRLPRSDARRTRRSRRPLQQTMQLTHRGHRRTASASRRRPSPIAAAASSTRRRNRPLRCPRRSGRESWAGRWHGCIWPSPTTPAVGLTRAAGSLSSTATARPCRPVRPLGTQQSSGQFPRSCTRSLRRESSRGRENSGPRGFGRTGSRPQLRRATTPPRTLIPPTSRRSWSLENSWR
jgi:hypothetical protein